MSSTLRSWPSGDLRPLEMVHGQGSMTEGAMVKEEHLKLLLDLQHVPRDWRAHSADASDKSQA